MWSYNYTQQPDELYHYGVLGMKWGQRKAIVPSVSQTSTNRAVDKSIRAKQKMNIAKKAYKSANKSFNKSYRNYSSPILNSQFNKADNKRRYNDVSLKAAQSERARKAYKKAKANYKISKKQASIAVRDVKKQYRKQYMAGESFVGKIYGKLTDADRYYADMQYNLHRNDK